MKRTKTIAVLMTVLSFAFMFSSCEKAILADAETEDESSNIEEGMGELYVTCKFSQTMSEITRATSTPLYECASRVQYVIMQDQNIVYNAEQVNGGGSSFGTLAVNLSPGTYRLLVMAHNETNGNPVTVDGDGMFQGYNKRATDSFSYSTEVVVTKDKRKAVTCNLTRCVAFVCFSSKDEIPSEVSKFKIELEGVSSKYDLVNQIGADSYTYSTATVNVSGWKSSAGLLSNVTSYVFLPSVSQNINAKFDFYNEAGDVVYSRTLENIQMKINAKTTVTASFFQQDGADANISVDNEWGDPINVEY